MVQLFIQAKSYFFVISLFILKFSIKQNQSYFDPKVTWVTEKSFESKVSKESKESKHCPKKVKKQISTKHEQIMDSTCKIPIKYFVIFWVNESLWKRITCNSDTIIIVKFKWLNSYQNKYWYIKPLWEICIARTTFRGPWVVLKEIIWKMLFLRNLRFMLLG